MKQYHLKNILTALIVLACFSSTLLSAKTKTTTPKKSTKVKKSSTAKKTDKTKKRKSKVVIKKSVNPTHVTKNKKLYAYIKTQNLRSFLYLTGITNTNLEYKVKFRAQKIPIKEIQSANFMTDYSSYKIRVLEQKEEYNEAASQIIRDIAPALKYIKLPNNNLVDPLFDAAYLYIKQASVYDDKKSRKYNKKKAQEEYAKAYRVFKKITNADWYYGAQLAELNTIFCNIRMHKEELAKKQFAEIEVPSLGDEAYGLYWLIDSQLKFHKKQFSAALDSVVKSIVFDTKNIHTFPESLLLSAYCYEDKLDNYRARDTYLEVAKLFQGTPEGEIAFSSLKFLRQRKLTEQAEDVGLEKVFFDSFEDVNKKVDDYIVKKEEDDRKKEERRKFKEKQKIKNK